MSGQQTSFLPKESLWQKCRRRLKQNWHEHPIIAKLLVLVTILSVPLSVYQLILPSAPSKEEIASELIKSLKELGISIPPKPQYDNGHSTISQKYGDIGDVVRGKLAEAALALKSKSYKRAFDLYRALSEMFPEIKELWYNSGYAAIELKQYPEAVGFFRRVLVIDSLDAAARNNLALALDAQGKYYDEAVTEFRMAARLNPELVQVHLNLGNMLLKRGVLDEAESEFRKTITLDSTISIAHFNLASILSQSNRHDEAVSHVRLFLKFAPANGNDEQKRFARDFLFRVGG